VSKSNPISRGLLRFASWLMIPALKLESDSGE